MKKPEPPYWFCILGIKGHESFGEYGAIQNLIPLNGKYRASFYHPNRPYTIRDYSTVEAARAAVEEHYTQLMSYT